MLWVLICVVHLTVCSQWTFWYCNDVGVTSPSISPWHYWYIVNEAYDDVNLRYQSDIRISILDQSYFNIAMTSSQWRTLSSRKKSSRTVCHFSISSNNAAFILWQLKIKASVKLFLSCCYEKFVKYFQTALLCLKFFLIL